MRKKIFILLSGIVVFGGCSPMTENIARKAAFSPSQEQLAAQDSTRVAPLQDDGSAMDPRTQEVIQEYGPIIKHYADRYGFDWRLILAVIKQESNYEPEAESYKGASGLMQMMPVTGEEVARILDLDDVSHPRNNIRGGIFYLKRLYGLFETSNEADRLKLTLAAYNAGIGRVYDAQDLAAYLNSDPEKWESVKEALPLLSKRYYTLHRSVWPQEKPRAGWFGNARETIAYVDSIMDYYDNFRLLLN